MPTEETITFRTQTVGTIDDLVDDEGLDCSVSQRIISFLTGALLNYRDEGVELVPTVLFCDDADGVFSSFPGTVKYRVGEAPLEVDSAKRILKE